ncbi:arsenate reductase family protein [Brevibacillus sp. NRS-1366]|uniref:arsenate reductase family protein n=1 Tax=Brevibacillus sp. NRS-1366 TaxID=3233899 RepID=UPI003D22A1D3
MTWTIFVKPDCVDSEKGNAWLKNHGIPFQKVNVFAASKEQISLWAKLSENGAAGLIDQEQKTNPAYQTNIHNQSLSDQVIVAILADHPALIKTPVITNNEQIMIGYDSDKMKSTFRFVKVRTL